MISQMQTLMGSLSIDENKTYAAIDYVAALNNAKYYLMDELNAGGLIWEYAVLTDFIKVNDDGTIDEEQNEYLRTFDYLSLINDDVVEFKNSFGDTLIVPMLYVTDPNFKQNLVDKVKAHKNKKIEQEIEMRKKRSIQKEKIEEIKKIADENFLQVEIEALDIKL